MQLNKDEVKHVAKLANLPLSDEEITKFEGQLSETLKFIEQLNQVDTEQTEPTYQVTGLNNVTRPDETEPSLTQEESLRNTHSKEKAFFKVKAIFEG